MRNLRMFAGFWRASIRAFLATSTLVLFGIVSARVAMAQVELLRNGGFELAGGSDPCSPAPRLDGWIRAFNDFHADARFPNSRTGTGYAYVSQCDGSPGNDLLGELYQQVTIPSTAISATLTFWYRISTQESGTTPFDVLNVRILDANGNFLDTVAVRSNRDANSQYGQVIYPASAWIGRTIRVDFLATTDFSLPTVFRIDDVSLQASIPERLLTIQSILPNSGVSIAVSPADKSGQSTGATPFSRRYDNNVSVCLEAPQTAGGNNFHEWRRDGGFHSSSRTTCVTMDADHTMTAVYQAAPRTLTVNSSNPSSGVLITVSPSDRSGQGDGTTPFTRLYDNNATVCLEAPQTAGGNNFLEWRRDGGFHSSSRTTCVTMDADHTMTAAYTSATRNLSIESVDPNAGVSVSVNPPDKEGRSEGITPFNLTYDAGTAVTVRAVSTAPGFKLIKWEQDGIPICFSSECSIVLEFDRVLSAVHAPITGYVVMRSGDKRPMPMRDALVSLRDGRGEEQYDHTDASGAYAFRRPCLPGVYQVRATIFYDDPITGRPISISNYPDQNPDWEVVCDGTSLLRAPQIRFPEPVVLQSGWRGTSETWTLLRSYLQADPNQNAEKRLGRVPAFLCFAVPESSEAPPDIRGYDNSGDSNHDLNAEILKEWIDQKVRSRLRDWLTVADADAALMNIVAHSMGAVIARAWVANYAPPAFRVASLDGVHGGTTKARLLGLSSLTEAFLNGTNLQETTPDSTCESRIVDYGGWNFDHTIFAHRSHWLLYSCVEEGVDAVTPDDSAWGCGRIMLRHNESKASGLRSKWLQGITVEVGDDHGNCDSTEDSCITTNPVRHKEIACFLADGSVPNGNATTSGSRGGPDVDESNGVSGTLLSLTGAAVSRVVAIDSPQVIRGRIMLVGSGAAFRLFDASGTVVVPAVRRSKTVAVDALLEEIEVIDLDSASLRIELSGELGQAVQLGFELYTESAVRLKATLDDSIVDRGRAASMACRFEDPDGTTLIGTDPSFVAVIRFPDGSERSLNLHDPEGDGTFEASFSETMLEGQYLIEFQARSAFGSVITERSLSSRLIVQPDSARFSGVVLETVVDSDMDGRLDSVLVSPEVAFDRSGSFAVEGRCEDEGGTVVKTFRATMARTSGPGTESVQVEVTASEIRASHVIGRLALKETRITDLEAGSLVCDVLNDFTTRAIDYRDFETPGLDEAKLGNVGALTGTIQNVLFVNGVKGFGDERRLVVNKDDLFQIRIKAPLAMGATPAAFALYAWIGEPTEDSVTDLPGGLGASCMPMPPNGGRPKVVWNNTGDAARFGVPRFESSPAPSLVFRRTSGIRRRVTFFLQGVIADPSSPSGEYAITNGIVVVSQ